MAWDLVKFTYWLTQDQCLCQRALLQQNLNEEMAADKNLTAIAKNGVNQKAA
jgi:ferritin-like metal-binding protein YciE